MANQPGRLGRTSLLSRGHSALLLLAGLLALGLSACGGSDGGAGDAPVGPTGYQAAMLAPPKMKPALVLTDTSGQPFDLQNETEGFVTLLFVGYTNCPDICPIHMSQVATALESMPAEEVDKVKVVFITSDPARDTAEALRKWLDHFDPAFIGLVPSEGQLDEVTSALTMNPIQTHDLGDGRYAVDHAAYILAFGANDNMARLGFLGGMPQEVYDHDIPKLVRDTVRD